MAKYSRGEFLGFGAALAGAYGIGRLPAVAAETPLGTAPGHADLIALGTHFKTGVSRLVLGSVSEEILERSPIPVLLVHSKRGTFADTPAHIPLTTGVGLASAHRLG